MPDWKNIINAFSKYIGEKLDAIANKESIGVHMEGVSLVTLKGDPGETPSDERLVKLIEPLIPEPIKGDTPSDQHLEFLIKPLIPNPIKGDTPSQAELTKLIKPLIPKPIKGDPGISPSKAEVTEIIRPLIPKPIKGDPGSPDTGEEIVDKINKDKSGKVIKKEHVEGLNEIESRVRTAEANTHSPGGYLDVWRTGAAKTVHNLSVQLTAPTNPLVGDLWVDIS